MIRKNWRNKSHPHDLWFAKLAEEFGEVANERVNSLRNEGDMVHMIEELEHVEFIARNYRRQLQRERDSWIIHGH